jgi:tripartite-type tricarboxylate transporter receptor subunit TctC
MKFERRQFLHLAAGAAVLPTASRIARAQSYPTRPVRIIVGAPPGGGHDIYARLIAARLEDRLGQSFFIDNRPGANTNIGAQAAAKAAPDGYTLLLLGATHAMNMEFYGKLAVDITRDIVPVAALSRVAFVMVVHPSVPAKTVPEFISYAKANPGKLNMASGAISEQLCGELFKMMADVSMLDVPYRGTAPALIDLLGGQTQVYFAAISPTVEHIRAGKLRALAVTTAMRSEVLPEVPTVGEFLPGFEVSGWTGIGAPRNTPADIISKLNSEVNAALAGSVMKGRLAEFGSTPLLLSPTEFGNFISDETEKWVKVIRAANIKPMIDPWNYRYGN